ncbi:MAG TPA: MarR family transcriptional regulator [Myxococcaceae bacterium]|nr:MarR family transcriptional regulator [Myxococcaceae bacterium]
MHFAEQVGRLRRAVYRVLAQRLSKRTDMPLERLLLLAWAHHRNVTSQAELAAHFLIEPSAVSRMVDRLEEEGYARRATGEDRRRVHVEVTEAGLQQLTIFGEALDTLTRDLGTELTETERRELRRLLEKAERALEAALTRGD